MAFSHSEEDPQRNCSPCASVAQNRGIASRTVPSARMRMLIRRARTRTTSTDTPSTSFRPTRIMPTPFPRHSNRLSGKFSHAAHYTITPADRRNIARWSSHGSYASWTRLPVIRTGLVSDNPSHDQPDGFRLQRRRERTPLGNLPPFSHAASAAGGGGVHGLEGRMPVHRRLPSVIRRNGGRKPFPDEVSRVALEGVHIPLRHNAQRVIG